MHAITHRAIGATVNFINSKGELHEGQIVEFVSAKKRPQRECDATRVAACKAEPSYLVRYNRRMYWLTEGQLHQAELFARRVARKKVDTPKARSYPANQQVSHSGFRATAAARRAEPVVTIAHKFPVAMPLPDRRTSRRATHPDRRAKLRAHGAGQAGRQLTSVNRGKPVLSFPRETPSVQTLNPQEHVHGYETTADSRPIVSLMPPVRVGAPLVPEIMMLG